MGILRGLGESPNRWYLKSLEMIAHESRKWHDLENYQSRPYSRNERRISYDSVAHIMTPDWGFLCLQG